MKAGANAAHAASRSRLGNLLLGAQIATSAIVLVAAGLLLHSLFNLETYNLGFERFHRMLARFPKVDFIGHAQTWWGNIDKNHQQAVMYPKGPVTPGGITDRLLSKP